MAAAVFFFVVNNDCTITFIIFIHADYSRTGNAHVPCCVKKSVIVGHVKRDIISRGVARILGKGEAKKKIAREAFAKIYTPEVRARYNFRLIELCIAIVQVAGISAFVPG